MKHQKEIVTNVAVIKQLKMLLLSVALLLAACHKNEEIDATTDPSNPSDPDTEISENQRMEVLGEIDKFIEKLPQENPLISKAKIFTFLKSLPEFKQVYYEGGDILAEFKDGIEYMIVDNRSKVGEIVPPVGFPGFTTPNNQRKSQAPSNARVGLPGTDKVYLFNSLGNSFKSTAYARSVFKASFDSKGYDVILKDGTIENLKSINDAGVFYFSTHGGFGKIGNDSLFRAWTSDVVSEASSAGVYKKDLKEKNLMIMRAFHNIGPDGKDQAETHYAITEKFVEKYMRFSENAMIYMDACKSFLSRGFEYACIKKSNYTGTYLGWTYDVDDKDAYQSAAYYFDRLLADNAPYETVKPESPNQRAFDIPSIFQDMLKKDLGISSGNLSGANITAYLSFHSGPNSITSLRPSIAYLLMDELTGSLNIWGSFGEDLGREDCKVTIDGVPVEQIDFWTPEMISCKIKATGKGSAGDVIVKVRNHESHPRTLTEWRGQIKYKRPSEGSLVEEITFNIHLRGDAHKYRPMPGEKPIPVPSDQNIKVFAKDSKASYSLGGAASHTFTSGCTHTNLVAWSDLKGELLLFDPFIIRDQPDADFFVAEVQHSENGFQINNLGFTLHKESTATFKSHYKCPDGEGDNDVRPQPVKLATLPGEFRAIKLAFDKSFNIIPGKLTARQLSRAGIPHGGEAIGDPYPTFETTIEWSFTTKFPPKSNAALRVGY